jgi:THO complex subunit 1
MANMDLEMAETEEDKRQVEERKYSYVWKGLRNASKKQLSLFDRIEHGKGLEALQPATFLVEAVGDDTPPTILEDKGHEEDQSVGEQRAGQHGQVTAETAA